MLFHPFPLYAHLPIIRFPIGNWLKFIDGEQTLWLSFINGYHMMARDQPEAVQRVHSHLYIGKYASTLDEFCARIITRYASVCYLV